MYSLCKLIAFLFNYHCHKWKPIKRIQIVPFMGSSCKESVDSKYEICESCGGIRETPSNRMLSDCETKILNDKTTKLSNGDVVFKKIYDYVTFTPAPKYE
jgi:hypothetical protein